MRSLGFGLLFAAVLACGGREPPMEVEVEQDPNRAAGGSVYSVEHIGSYPGLLLRLILWWTDESGALKVEHGISLFRVEYWTTGTRGNLALASGLMAVPKKRRVQGVVSYQHGTRTARSPASSTPSKDEALPLAAVFAGHGYLFLAPDYLGLGTSESAHPYLQAQTEANAVTDLLTAARSVAAARGLAWPESLFLTGFSQGGHATLAAHRALEDTPKEGLLVTASAVVAAPSMLSSITFPFALEGHAESHPLYLGYLATAYARVYQQPLSSIVREPYDTVLPELFDGSHEGEEIRAELPSQPRSVFRNEFLMSFEAGGSDWFSQALAANDVHEWGPRAPVRLYFGEQDVDVPPGDSKRTMREMISRGGDAEAISVGESDHYGSILAAIPLIRAWFDELVAEQAARAAQQGVSGPPGQADS